ncbi:ABC transporter substrate-binding protein [Sulfolobales archaeon HS-7]|nr:ABC transporter substrate-binding protein [Sulfolobales archaeon HS-7]
MKFFNVDKVLRNMTTIRVGALADSGDLYPMIPIMEGWVKEEGINTEFEVIQTVQDINERVIKRELDVSVPSAALYPYIQDFYFVMSNGVAAATDGITGMPILAANQMKFDELPDSRVIVHGLNTTAFTLYKLFIGKYRRLVVVRKVIDELNALGREGDVIVAVHEIKAMYQLKKLGKEVYKVGSMWELWKEFSSSLPMPMGMVVFNKELGKEVGLKFKSLYERSKRFAERNLETIIKKDAEIMSSVHGTNFDKGIMESTIRTDIDEYNVPFEKVKSGMEVFYKLAEERGVLPRVKEIDVL